MELNLGNSSALVNTDRKLERSISSLPAVDGRLYHLQSHESPDSFAHFIVIAHSSPEFLWTSRRWNMAGVSWAVGSYRVGIDLIVLRHLAVVLHNDARPTFCNSERESDCTK